MQLPWGLQAGSITELAGVGVAILGTLASIAYTRHTFRLTQQPAWRVTVGDISYSGSAEDGVSTGVVVAATEWVIQNVGKLGALEVTVSLKLDRRMRGILGMYYNPVTFAAIDPGQAFVIAGGSIETWPSWRRYADGRTKVEGLRPVRNRAQVEWVDTQGKTRKRAVRIVWRADSWRQLPSGSSQVPDLLSGDLRPE